METNDYVRLVRDRNGTIIDSFDANGEYRAMEMEIKTQKQLIADLRELLMLVRRIAVEVSQEAVVAHLRQLSLIHI